MSSWSSDAAVAHLAERRREKHARLAEIARTRPIPDDWLSLAFGCAKNTAARFPCGPDAHGLGREDLVAEALAGAWENLLTYDPARGGALTSWVIQGCRSAIFEALRRADCLTRMERDEFRTAYRHHCEDPEIVPEPTPARVILSLDAVCYEHTDGYDPLNLRDCVAAPDPEIEDAAERLDRERWLTVAWSVLDARKTRVVRLYTEGVTFKEIARIENISESRVHQLWGESLFKMRVALGLDTLALGGGSRTKCSAGHPITVETQSYDGKCRLCKNAKQGAKRKARQEAPA